MRKIFFIRANKTKYGGAENYLFRLSKALNDREIHHQIVNSRCPKFLPSWLRVVLFSMQVCFKKSNRFYFSLERISCPDIYRAGDGVHKAFLAVERKSKLNPLHPVYLFLEKRCFNNAKCIIANSYMIKNEIVNIYDINPEKIDVVYNGVESKKVDYQSSFNRLSKEFNIRKNTPILLYVGSGFKRKGVEEFLEIIGKLEVKNIRAFVIGKEKNIEHYKQLSKDLKVDKNVIFTGSRTDVDDFYVVSDFFILPTHYEPFSNVVIEAMSFNNVVFTTSQNGASEILDKEYVMENSKDYSIVKKINELISNTQRLEEVKYSNKLISKEFSIERNLEQTLSVIKKSI